MAKKSKKSKINTDDYKYVTLSVRGKDGKLQHSRGNGDAVHKAMLLHLANGGTVQQIVSANGFDKFSGGGNEGTLRMSVGVALRAAIKAGEPVKIGSITVKSLKQAVAMPKVEKHTASASRKKAKKPASRKKRSKSAAATPAAEVPTSETAQA